MLTAGTADRALGSLVAGSTLRELVGRPWPALDRTTDSRGRFPYPILFIRRAC